MWIVFPQWSYFWGRLLISQFWFGWSWSFNFDFLQYPVPLRSSCLTFYLAIILRSRFSPTLTLSFLTITLLVWRASFRAYLVWLLLGIRMPRLWCFIRFVILIIVLIFITFSSISLEVAPTSSHTPFAFLRV